MGASGGDSASRRHSLCCPCGPNHLIKTGLDKYTCFFGSSSFCDEMQVRLSCTPKGNVLDDGLDSILTRGSASKEVKRKSK